MWLPAHIFSYQILSKGDQETDFHSPHTGAHTARFLIGYRLLVVQSAIAFWVPVHLDSGARSYVCLSFFLFFFSKFEAEIKTGGAAGWVGRILLIGDRWMASRPSAGRPGRVGPIRDAHSFDSFVTWRRRCLSIHSFGLSPIPTRFPMPSRHDSAAILFFDLGFDFFVFTFFQRHVWIPLSHYFLINRIGGLWKGTIYGWWISTREHLICLFESFFLSNFLSNINQSGIKRNQSFYERFCYHERKYLLHLHFKNVLFNLKR